ncbi:MAG: hypothetical protein A3E87_05705 [Gammaproteobacteria bacterium RIFCSPHIGHO2_12_FULL_35_23]|nr:MAG: hypothetical protein A3E87_05705 [Gammaproteobacteria bacterium RIFCSPHIGHO2_12_FULL_35_23]
MQSKLSHLPIFETARIIMKLPAPEDIFAMQDILNDLITMRHLKYLTYTGKEWTEITTKIRVQSHIDGYYKYECALFHMFEKQTGKLMGVVGFPELYLPDKKGVFGIILHHLFWRNQYALEAHLTLLEYGFETLGLENIIFKTMEENTGMRNFFVNFDINLYEIEENKVIELDGKHKAQWRYRLTKPEWKKVKALFLSHLQK